MLATPTAPTDQGDRSQPEEEAVERALGGGARDQCGRGLAYVDLVGGSGLAVAASTAWTALTWSVAART